MTDLFGPDLEAYEQGRYRDWKHDRDGRLATSLLLDQYTRNIHRGSSLAFKFDSHSLAVSHDILKNVDYRKEYALFERVFLIMPFMHAENKSDTELCIKEM